MGTFSVRAHSRGDSGVGDIIEVEGSNLTVIVPNENMDAVDILDDDVTLIDPESTVRLMRECSPELWTDISKTPRFIKLWRKVYTDSDPPASLENAGLGTLHVAGMIVLITLAITSGKRPHLRFPETYLHPAQHYCLADLFVEMQSCSKS